MSDVFAMIAVERRRTADLLDGLSDDQWNTPSLCNGWRVREVVAHLSMPFTVSIPRLAIKMIAARGSFDTVADRFARADARSNAELVAILRSNAEDRFTPPGFGPEAPLTDIVVHSQDICEPLGIVRAIDDEPAAVILDMLASPKASRGFVRKDLLDGLRLTATDTGWTHGEGAEVSGTAASLIMTISGRRVAEDQLSGGGAAMLRSRLSA